MYTKIQLSFIMTIKFISILEVLKTKQNKLVPIAFVKISILAKETV